MRKELLDAILGLLPGQFDVFVYKLEIPVQYIPSPQASQASRAVELLRYLEANQRLPDAFRLIEAITEGPSEFKERWPVVSPTTTLLDEVGNRVLPNAWSLSARPRINLNVGNAELWQSIEKSLVRYDIGNYGRTAQWPLAFKSTDFSRGDSNWKWRRAYQTAANVEVEEQLLVGLNGILTFQRATAWKEQGNPIEIDVLCADTVCFLRYIGRVFMNLASNENRASPDIDIRCELSGRIPAIALFGETVMPVDRFRTARLKKSPIEAIILANSGLLASNAGHVCDMSKKLLNRITGQFEVEPGQILSSGRPFLEIEGKVFSELAIRLVD